MEIFAATWEQMPERDRVVEVHHRIDAAERARDGESLELEDLRTFLRAHLSGYKLPRAMTVVPEVPRNAAGKAQYPRAQELAARTWRKINDNEILTRVDADVPMGKLLRQYWIPFLRASALVMEIGGFLSHGSIVAREYGIPAVANLPGVTRAIVDGMWLVVDGGSGHVSARIKT